jgi:hypothetical protein
VQPGQTVAVVGCGPVGLLAVLAAQHLGAGKVSSLGCGTWSEFASVFELFDEVLVCNVDRFLAGYMVDLSYERLGKLGAVMSGHRLLLQRSIIRGVRSKCK